MSNRSWFYAFEGQQKGPFPEAQLRDLILRGVVGPDTLVWTEGMAGWQKAGEIPGLISTASGPPTFAQPGAPAVTAGGYSGGVLSADLPLWSFFGRSVLYVIGLLLVIPAPWVATSFYGWLVSRLDVPGRPNLAFNGQVGDIWYVFILMGLLSYGGFYDTSIQLIGFLVQAFLSWIVLRWIVGNLSSNGQPLPIAFDGNVFAFVGWQVLIYISLFTIIGWAWVVTAFVRWICRNISGTRREVIFNASGLEMLWRTIVFVIACVFLIPIPWALRWYAQWYVSQFALVERSTLANA
jgi:GYF domain 2